MARPRKFTPAKAKKLKAALAAGSTIGALAAREGVAWRTIQHATNDAARTRHYRQLAKHRK